MSNSPVSDDYCNLKERASESENLFENNKFKAGISKTYLDVILT